MPTRSRKRLRAHMTLMNFGGGGVDPGGRADHAAKAGGKLPVRVAPMSGSQYNVGLPVSDRLAAQTRA